MLYLPKEAVPEDASDVRPYEAIANVPLVVFETTQLVDAFWLFDNFAVFENVEPSLSINNISL